jgi:hypothetical protein
MEKWKKWLGALVAIVTAVGTILYNFGEQVERIETVNKVIAMIPWVSRAKIDYRPTQRPFNEAGEADDAVFANEIVLLQLKVKGVKPDRVVWLFDEAEPVVHVVGDVEHAFPYVPKESNGKQFRRVDAFYKDGDDYGHVYTRIPVNNIKLAFNVSVDSAGIKSSANSDLVGQWKLSSFNLTTYDDGKYKWINQLPSGSSATGKETNVKWDFTGIANAFGDRSVEEVKGHIASDKKIWVTAKYESIDGKGSIVVSKPVPTNYEENKMD